VRKEAVVQEVPSLVETDGLWLELKHKRAKVEKLNCVLLSSYQAVHTPILLLEIRQLQGVWGVLQGT
jgi:hypothetical protein